MPKSNITFVNNDKRSSVLSEEYISYLLNKYNFNILKSDIVILNDNSFDSFEEDKIYIFINKKHNMFNIINKNVYLVYNEKQLETVIDFILEYNE